MHISHCLEQHAKSSSLFSKQLIHQVRIQRFLKTIVTWRQTSAANIWAICNDFLSHLPVSPGIQLHWFNRLVSVNLLQCSINSNTHTITYSVLIRDGFILLVCSSGSRRKSTGCLQHDCQISLVDYWQTQGKSSLSSNREHEVWSGGVFQMMVLENPRLNTFSENINSLHCVLFVKSLHWIRISSARTSWTALL